MGPRWRIGDETNIRIFEDRWLPDVGGGKILSPDPNLPRDATVETLIDGDSTNWNFQLMDKTFLPFEASRIKVIPLCLNIMLFIQNQTLTCTCPYRNVYIHQKC